MIVAVLTLVTGVVAALNIMKTLDKIKQIIGDREDIIEAKNGALPDPPMIVILKRKAIRLFPNGRRVALYHSDKLGIDVSIPYSPSNFSKEVAGIAEELLIEKEHDDLFGDYTQALKQHITSGFGHATHPELHKLQQKVQQKYGKKAFGHLHLAAEHYLNGNAGSAARHYSKFEREVNEEFVDIELDQLDEAVIHKLHHIVKTKQAGDVTFKNGSSARVEHPQAAHIMKLHSALNPQNKTRIETLVNSGPAGLERVANFAAENLR